MKRIKINATFKEDEEERRVFFRNISYAKRLKYFFENRNKINFHKVPLKWEDLKIDYSYSIPTKLILNS